MAGQNVKVSKTEVRIPIGECPWCGADKTTLRDYLCYSSVNKCCHELFRTLPGKASIALRKFPGSRVDSAEDLHAYILAFYSTLEEDKRTFEKYEGWLKRIEKFQQEFDGELTDFFMFLVRLYVARGYLEMKGNFLDQVMRQCLVCGNDLPENSRREICSTCMEHVGTPEGGFDVKPAAKEPEKTAPHRGMVFRSK